MKFSFPKVYPILDSSAIALTNREGFLRRLGESLAAAGVTLLEYRNKTGSDAEVVSDCRILRGAMPGQNIKLILDDRVNLIDLTCFDGVHVDAGDLSPREARRLLGPDRIIGTYGGGEALLPEVLREPADYFSIGPVFATTTKQTSKSLIGVEGVRRLREQAGPGAVLVAAAGITLETAPAVLAAGASVVAVSAAIFKAGNPPEEFRRWLDFLQAA